MMESFFRYKTLLKVYLNSFETVFMLFGKKGEKQKDKPGGAKRILGVTGIVILILVVYSSYIFTVYNYSLMSVENGFYKEFLYVLIGLSQLFVLFLGGSVAMTNLYFSEDAQLLLSLPITSYETYAAKFTVTYLSQLIISAFFVPFLIAYGIALSTYGVFLGAWFYILSVLSFLLTPAVPMFVFSIFSTPFLFLASLFKRKEVAKTVFSLLSSLLFFAVYFVFILGPSGMGDDPETGAEMISLYKGFGKAFIYNYSFCESMLGNNPALNIFVYIAENVLLLALTILFCGFLYKKIIPRFMETGSIGKKRTKRKDVVFSAGNIRRNLMLKDIKLILNNPSLYISVIICCVMIIVWPLLSSNLFFDAELNVYANELMKIGFCSYMAIIMIAASASSLSGVLVSLEGKNFATLKSLPIPAKEVVGSKMKVSSAISIAYCLLYFISTVATAKNVASVMLILVSSVLFGLFGVGVNSMLILKDLSKPNFLYVSVNELTKNNKKMIKPMLLITPIGLVVMIADMVCAGLFGNLWWIGYVIHVAILSATVLPIFIVNTKKLSKNAEMLYANTEI